MEMRGEMLLLWEQVFVPAGQLSVRQVAFVDSPTMPGEQPAEK
jgi:hypothetical protein